MDFQYLERQMNLPSHVKLVSVHEQQNNMVMFRIAVEGEPDLPADYSIPSLSEMGEFFANPEKYKREVKNYYVPDNPTQE
jgi:hypothetical protein